MEERVSKHVGEIGKQCKKAQTSRFLSEGLRVTVVAGLAFCVKTAPPPPLSLDRFLVMGFPPPCSFSGANKTVCVLSRTERRRRFLLPSGI